MPKQRHDGRRPARRRTRRRQRDVDLRRTASSRTSGSTPSSADPSSEYSFEPTRFDEMRRGAWDIDARIHDMDLNGVWRRSASRRSCPGFAGQRLQMGVSDPELALADRPGVERLAHRGVGRPVPRPHHPDADAVPPRSRGRRRRDPSQRRARLQGGDVLRGARRSSACRRCTPGYWDPIMRRLRGDRDGRVPARRLVRHVADHAPTTRRPTSSACCSSATRCSPPSTGCTRRSRCASRTSRSACRRVASAGSPGSSTGSTTCCSYHDDVRHLATTSSSRPPRCCSATSGSARSTTRPVSSSATASASTTSSSSPTTPTPTPPGPIRRPCSATRSATSRPTTSRR